MGNLRKGKRKQRIENRDMKIKNRKQRIAVQNESKT